MCSVTTDTDDSVIIKIVNFSETDDPVCISIDCDVKSEYEVSQLTGKADFEKTADYSLLSVLAGEGKLTVDGKDYPIQKGKPLYLTERC